ncbi:MAG: PilN domain-containing protein [Deltaproteobacteria bacterium]|nr:PilN domain-containing protein [Deltaproteobacteria bacterium]
MIRINLLPVRVSKKKVAGRQQLYLLALAIVLVLVGNYVWSSTRAEALTSREQKLRRTRDEIAQLERIIGEVKNIKAQQQELKDKLAVLEKLRAGRQGPVKVLDELATIIPKKLWLRKMEEKGGRTAFDGTAFTIDDVSQFMSALRRSPYFREVELKKTTARADKRYRVVDFTITANTDYTPVAPATAAAPGAPAAPAPAPAR